MVSVLLPGLWCEYCDGECACYCQACGVSIVMVSVLLPGLWCEYCDGECAIARPVV